ncbi:MAG: sigma-70 family RNA polymerase sigma factor [Planctomycetota bacterium]
MDGQPAPGISGKTSTLRGASGHGAAEPDAEDAVAAAPDGADPEAALIAKSLAGDETALEQLLLRYYDRLLSYIRQQLPTNLAGKVGPEDILQHTYLKAFRAIGGFEPRSGYSFFSWLKRIADNERTDQYRKAKREAVVSTRPKGEQSSGYADMVGQLAGDDPTATVLARRRELIGVLHVTLAGMKPQHRQVIELYHLEGRSVEQVAETLDLTTGQVRGLLHRARASLKDAINRLSHFV